MYKSAKITSYKDLIVYQKSQSLTVDIIKYFSKERDIWAKQFILNQLFRSVSSISANLAEGFGRNYKGSFKNHVSIARGSSFETEYWLEILLELDEFKRETLRNFIDRNSEIIKMLTKLMNKTKGGKTK